MGGKRDDVADSIRYFLNRYGGNAGRVPTRREWHGCGVRPDVPLPMSYDFDDGIRTPFDGDFVDGEISDFQVFDRALSYEGGKSLHSRIGERIERDAFDRLYSAAGSTVSVVDRPVTPSTLRDALHDLRHVGHGKRALHVPNIESGASEPEGAIFVVGRKIGDDVRDHTSQFYRVGEWQPDDLPNVEGIPIKESSHYPADKGVLVDVAAIAPPTPGVAHVRPFVVRDPSGIVAIDRVETAFEWVGE